MNFQKSSIYIDFNDNYEKRSWAVLYQNDKLNESLSLPDGCEKLFKEPYVAGFCFEFIAAEQSLQKRDKSPSL